MKVHVDASALRRTSWSEYGMRFLFGGAITAAAAVIAKKFGPGVGGLFLAFPAIFPASATLIEKHEGQKKERKGLHGTSRGRAAAGIEAAGAAIGGIGLIFFAILVWRLLPSLSTWTVLGIATLAWLAVSVTLWATCEKMRNVRRWWRHRKAH